MLMLMLLIQSITIFRWTVRIILLDNDITVLKLFQLSVLNSSFNAMFFVVVVVAVVAIVTGDIVMPSSANALSGITNEIGPL